MNDYNIIYRTYHIDSLSFRFENVNPLIYHYFRVTVSDTFGYQTKGSIFSSSFDSIPDPVDVKSVNYDYEKVEVVWGKSNAGDFDNYKLLYSKTTDGIKDTIAVFNNKVDTVYSSYNFNPTIENWYWVVVTDSLGQHSAGNGKRNKIDPPPKAVDIESVTYDLDSMYVNWDFSKDSDFKEYKLLYSSSINSFKDTLEIFQNQNTNAFTTSSFDPTKENWYWIAVLDYWEQISVGVGRSNEIDSPPSKPDIRIKYEPGKFLINWSKSMDHDFKKYMLYVSKSRTMEDQALILETETRDDTTFVLDGIQDINRRYFQVCVVDQFGLKNNSEIISTDITKSIKTVNLKDFDIVFIEKEKRPYYLWGVETKNENYSKDDDGVILLNGYYHPVLMSTKALTYLTTYQKTGDTWFLDKSMIHGEKIIELAEEYNGSYYFPYKSFNIIHNEYYYPNWYSGMAQGRWLSYFSLLFEETKNQTYKNYADKIFISLRDVFDAPNVIVIDSLNNYWIEEYPNAYSSPYHERGPTHVLNGFVFAIWGLYDYYWLDQNPEVLRLLRAALTTLYNRAIEYYSRFGGNSFYCLKHQKYDYAIASNYYHEIHIKQLNELYQMTNEQHFKYLSSLFHSDSN